LATKLALAEEFVSIGDDDGARALIEEVIAEASGDLKAKAQRALASLG
jgi:pilus assembly protein FimV